MAEPFNDINLLTYAAVFLGGMLASFTPCVYPIIPVTVSYIGANAAASRVRGFMLSLFYVLGIAVTYSALGLVAALGGRLFGEISANPWTHIVIGNIFLLLALSMLGVFTIQPQVILRINPPADKKKGTLGAFLVGVSSGFIVGPCTAPALGAVLAYVAGRQNIILGTTLLFTFAIGMGMLIIVIGTFAGILVSLPKSGKWLNSVKYICAVILIICAEYFILTAGKRF